jgi:hypothetical protein
MRSKDNSDHETSTRAVAARNIRRIANDFLAGEIEPLEAALALDAWSEIGKDADIRRPFLTICAITSETDAIPLGERRNLWHPDVRAAEDAKHDRAQEWARPLLTEACHDLLAALVVD